MKKILDFVDKVQSDIKFMGAGEGKTLADSSKPKAAPEANAEQKPQPSRAQPQEMSKAAQAALERLDKTQQPPASSKGKARQENSFASELEREREKEREREREREKEKQREPVTNSSSQNASASAIPPLEALPVDDGKNQSLAKAVTYLKRYGDEIRDGDFAPCSELLQRYADNITSNPTDPKYRRIKLSNKVFVEKVRDVPGAIQVLKTTGFEEKSEEVEGGSELFLIYPTERPVDFLVSLKTLLQEPLAVDRDIRIFLPSPNVALNEKLSDSVYTVTKEEVAAEQQRKRTELELAQTLRTKEMRERDELKHHKKYKMTKIRVRFADGTVLQAFFGAHEKAAGVFELVRFCLESAERPFKLTNSAGSALEAEGSQTLQELGLVPSGILNLRWGDSFKGNGLSESLLSLAQPL